MSVRPNVFISWSGPQSRAVATALAGWLGQVVQAIQPWMSDIDLAAGERWREALAHMLGNLSLGIICATPEAMGSQWLHFEAGALAKTMEESNGRVIPYLVGMSESELSNP